MNTHVEFIGCRGVRMLFLLMAGVVALLFNGILHAEEDQPVRLLATGSSTVAPLMTIMAQRYEKSNPGIRIDVQTGGSSRGVADAYRGVADIGMVSRPLGPREKGLEVQTVALDGVTVIVHRDNPISGLDKEQLVRIYTGKAVEWGEVGGPSGHALVAVSKSAGHSTLALFAAYLGLKPGRLVARAIVGDNQQAIKTVAGNPNAIGYVSIGAARQARDDGEAIRLLPLDGVPATPEAVARGDFPLSRPLNVVYRPPASKAVRDFLVFARDPDQHDLIRSLDFVPAP